MTDGPYRQELEFWARSRAATERITKNRGRPPQQVVPDWETDRDGGAAVGRIREDAEGVVHLAAAAPPVALHRLVEGGEP